MEWSGVEWNYYKYAAVDFGLVFALVGVLRVIQMISLSSNKNSNRGARKKKIL